jgi:copper homeostasis protein
LDGNWEEREVEGMGKLEVIAESIADAVAAEAGGADRIELVSALSEGGLTPSWGLVSGVVQAVKIPVHVMVRPHSRSFEYDREDMQVMRADIRCIRSLGAAGIVLGVLKAGGSGKQVDVRGLNGLLEEAGDLSVTFHRAFDETADLAEALRDLAEGCPRISRILTSGGKPDSKEAVQELGDLKVMGDRHRLTILAGGGLTVEALDSFIQITGVAEVHMGSGVRTHNVVDAAKVTAAKGIVQRITGEWQRI